MSGRTSELGLTWPKGSAHAVSRAAGPSASEQPGRSADAVAWVEQVINDAIERRASDVHFEPFRAQLRIRMRIDGQLQDVASPAGARSPEIASRIKVLAQMDIAEQRVPQDGRLEWPTKGRKVDLRVSTLPTAFGESIVIRVLDRNNTRPHLDGLHLPSDVLEKLRLIVGRPHGLVLVTGPTGSGKTTTLYSALSAVNSDEVKIITTEDPVEYEIKGLIQVPVDEEVGRSFAACLRAILRQDPDIVLVGEARDKETAQIAVQASLTGHLVFTTLHTNDAPTAITRLIDMGVEPFLLAATLETICAQRLVRTICVKCKAPYEPNDDELLQLNLKRRDVQSQRFYYGKGCDHCKNTGYKGRTALFELMDITDSLRELILTKASATQLRLAAQRAGMRPLRDAGIQKVFAGLTTIEEVVRETLAVEE